MKKILIMADYYEPVVEASGPVSSLRSLMMGLSFGAHFDVMTRLSGKKVKHITNLVVGDEWIDRDECRIRYSKNNISHIRHLYKSLKSKKFHALYCNSFFSLFYSFIPLFIILFIKGNRNTKVVVSPRGELSHGALSIKPVRKKLFILFSKLVGLHKNVLWHVTSEQESKDLIAYFPKAEFKVLPNIIDYSAGEHSEMIGDIKQTRIVFLSRIVKVKNLISALKAVSRLKQSIQFDIYGPIEDEVLWGECLKEIHCMPTNIECTYKGKLDKQKVRGTLKNYQVMLLPSLSENFGHALVEAMSVGCVLVTGNQTPWSEIQGYKAGYIVEPTSITEIEGALNHYINSSLEDKQRMFEQAKKYFSEKMADANLTNKMLHMFY